MPVLRKSKMTFRDGIMKRLTAQLAEWPIGYVFRRVEFDVCASHAPNIRTWTKAAIRLGWVKHKRGTDTWVKVAEPKLDVDLVSRYVIR